ncbi:hypothetical protein KRZ98_10070 [Sphingobium sp. AS12]|uniref:hypothetical protein n=1 Tax=Sphingobium sp. AS12 TaxID=2849495 RepID=UPI001C31C563|nr:hypothetical protein [Sphingobium sp. AS12]MBV2148631.1 hypothetical protein [Sphingobium sp. AS12]
MGSGFEALFAKYGWVWIGLSFGFLAKYALLIKRGVQVKVRLVLADLLLLPMVALIAFSLVTQAGVRNEAAALMTAFCTVGADRLIKLLTERFLARVEAATLRDVAADVVESRGDLRNAVQTRISAQRIGTDIKPD